MPAAKSPRKPKAWTPPSGAVRLAIWCDEELLWAVRQAAAADRMTIREWTTGLLERELRRRHGHHRPATGPSA